MFPSSSLLSKRFLPFCIRGCGLCCRSSGVPGNAAAAVVTVDGLRGKFGLKMDPLAMPFTVTPFSAGKVAAAVTAGVTVVTCGKKVSREI